VTESIIHVEGRSGASVPSVFGAAAFCRVAARTGAIDVDSVVVRVDGTFACTMVVDQHGQDVCVAIEHLVGLAERAGFVMWREPVVESIEPGLDASA
jgi:hypothetical protein